MSEIVKTEAIVLGKMDFSDTSIITNLFTRDFGKFSLILKGGRNPKNRIGPLIDIPNYLNIVFYKKENRELQLLSNADSINHFPGIKNDYDKIIYAFAVVEIIKKLIPDNELHNKLFNGVVRILTLLNSSDEAVEILFSRFFLFFLEEIGFQVQLNECSICGKNQLHNQLLGFNFNSGIICEDCKINYKNSYQIDAELFKYLHCLKFSKKTESLKIDTANKAIEFMEKYLKFHIPDFQGIQSLKNNLRSV
ncbi:MAG: DNA repair protein RecO [Ignavibacteriales bacterium]|nr:DNA repair protein RecO [Ignavibacteriales bacterium]